MENNLAEVRQVAGTDMATLGEGGFTLLTGTTSALGRVTPHRRVVCRLDPGLGRSNLHLIGLGGAGGALDDEVSLKT